MSVETEKYIGYLKYSGKSVENGLLDARKSAEALLGFDEVLRYFLLKEDPSLKEYDFDIPVRIRRGSWEMSIPEIIDTLISFKGVVSVATTTYVVASAKKAATDGMFEMGIAKDVKATFKAAIKSAQWMINIASHTGSLVKKKYENMQIKNVDQVEPTFELPSDKGEYLPVPKKYYDQFIECPEKLFSRCACIVEKERVLELGVYENDKILKATISDKEKSIFYSEREEVLFPELKHGQHVELEGNITRSNEATNTIGFQYQGHILTCNPEHGIIAKFKRQIISKDKKHFFPKVKIVGVIDRKDKNEEFKERKPQIVFSKIIPLESRAKGKQAEMFEDK